jgi:hypothetical protein
VGGIFGYNQDQVLENCSFSGKVKGTENTGGLIGRAYNKTPLSSPNDTSLSGRITKCYAAGSVTGKTHTGGLIGNMYSFGRGYTVDRCFFSGDAKGTSATGGLFGYAYAAGDFMVKNSYVKGSVTGNADTGGVYGILDKKDALARFKNAYVSVAVKGRKIRSGYIFGRPFPDYLFAQNGFYYNRTKTKSAKHGIRITGDGLYDNEPLAVTEAVLGREKPKGFDYKNTWHRRKTSGKDMYFPELKAFAGSKNKAKRSDSKESARTPAWYKVTYDGNGGQTAGEKTTAVKYVRYDRLKKATPPEFIRKGYKIKGITAVPPKKLPGLLKNDKTKVKIKWVKLG